MHEELDAPVNFRIKSSAIKLTPNHLHDSTLLTLGCFLGFGMAIKLWVFCFIQLTLLLGKLGLNIQEAHAYSTSDGYSLDIFVVDGWSTR
jgi:hypothetical protein